MKSVIFALVAVASIAASAQQDTTGCKIAKGIATCEVLNEYGNGYETVRFPVRMGSSGPEVDLGCPVGEASYAPCPTKFAELKLLKAISAAFDSIGGKPQDQSQADAGGPSN